MSSWRGPGRPVPDPGPHPFTIDPDSTICETYALGLALALPEQVQPASVAHADDSQAHDVIRYESGASRAVDDVAAACPSGDPPVGARWLQQVTPLCMV